MVEIFTIKEITRLRSGKIRITFCQRSKKPYESRSINANQFERGMKVCFKDKHLVPFNEKIRL